MSDLYLYCAACFTVSKDLGEPPPCGHGWASAVRLSRELIEDSLWGDAILKRVDAT